MRTSPQREDNRSSNQAVNVDQQHRRTQHRHGIKHVQTTHTKNTASFGRDCFRCRGIGHGQPVLFNRYVSVQVNVTLLAAITGMNRFCKVFCRGEMSAARRVGIRSMGYKPYIRNDLPRLRVKFKNRPSFFHSLSYVFQ